MKIIYILLLSILCTLITSCNNNNPDTPNPDDGKEVSIIGTWEIEQATRHNSEGATEEWTMVIGQTWTFDESNTISIDGQVYEYSLTDGVLTTTCAENYEANCFIINDLSKDSMTLSANHEEKDKVGRRTVTYTLIFARM